jgi:glycosyltransferase involved in cell wall biosynthesis
MDSPIITFALIGCNQVRFVQDAVESALAQTYRPLEIVLSDDCSDDGTFEVMMSLAKAYKGPHHLILNKNHRRRSIGGHINRVMELSHGEMIVIAAADDISLPHRTQALYEAWEESGRKATSIHSAFIQINESGEVIEEVIKNNNRSENARIIKQIVDPVAFVQGKGPTVFGCTHAWDPKLFQLFGNLLEEVTHEDEVLALRSILLDGLFYVDEKLVKYRLHNNNMFIRDSRPALSLKSIEYEEDINLRVIKNRVTMYSNFILDLEKARLNGCIGKQCFDETVGEATRLRRQYSLKREFLESAFLGKCRNIYRLLKDRISRQETMFFSARILPNMLFVRCKFAYKYAAFILKNII